MATEALMSYRKYAKHRGCALATVQRAIKDGRITDAVMMVEGKKLISVKKADELWVKNTDPRRANNYKGKKGADELYDPTPKKETEPSEQPKKAVDYQANRAIREAYAARMAKLNFEKQSGKLVDAKEAKDYMRKIHSRARDSLLNLPDKLGPKLAAENDIHKIIEMLNMEIQDVCNHFSNGEVDF